MHTRAFQPGGPQVSDVGIGTWQIGGAEWGDVSEADALGTLTAAADAGITFVDTADIYGLGRSETLIGKFLAARDDAERFFIATKLGRNPNPGWPDNFNADTIRMHTENSLRRLGVDRVHLTQTHCIPHEIMRQDHVWAALRSLKDEGLIERFGASVETMDEALTCVEVDGMASLQIIFNVFRQKPIDVLFDKAKEKGIAIIVRLPLASGLLAGKFKKDTTFAPTDHRNFNKDGDAFNVGETFAGLPFEYGVDLADELKTHVREGETMAQWAIRWCLDHDAVTTVIPGARNPKQAAGNAAASDLPPLGDATHTALRDLYRARIHDHIRGGY
ncbi:MAG: aldo/keto reductase [Phycisphaera sp.]|nr:aldo/keto reductase [Phycisphaera sp.]